MVIPVAALAVVRFTVGFTPTVLKRFCAAWCDHVQEKWLALVVVLVECVLRLRLAYTIVSTSATSPSQLADVFAPPQPGKCKLVILNHRSRIDWLVMFPFFARAGGLRTLRIVLKDELKRIPIFGWSMQTFRYIFLSRDWANDEATMRGLIAYYRESDGATIMFFPEGTDLSESNIEKSNAYAARHGLPCFHHVLNPRTTGFIAMANMIGAANLEIIDVTLGYTDFVPGERPAEVSVVNGRMPKKVHILCTRYRMAQQAEPVDEEKQALDAVPTDDAGLRLWLNDLFAKKELLLSQFYANNPVGFEAHQVRGVFGEHCAVFTYDEDEEALHQPGSTKFLRFVRDMGLWRSFGVILLWLLPVLYWVFFGGLYSFLVYGLFANLCSWVTRNRGGLNEWLFMQQPRTEATREKRGPSKRD
ncbi:acetyltransferase [Trypanosoma rangeli]|uniref:Acetyltransferase n=1 Tax=Trypanosoma rangeli TaxID=5698 RepID=A0A422NH08_TRYRA|nr:acetyltransferase [Trypanosoma rangeli]RNF04741.1 acetyltransferase [Trypanosoma rangeli]|eukprot:RNF04741.1 acetyltransferase [Trypanosoma rangeli]